LIEKLLENDTKNSPFKVISVETEITKDVTIETNGNKFNVKLLGRLDRVEEKDGVMRIVDYKTGRVDVNKVRRPLKYFDLIFTDPDYKEKFQQYFYSSIFLEGKNGLDIKVGIYPLRNISEGIVFFDEDKIPEETLLLFESKLKDMITKIFDSETPFVQTEVKERCRSCAYKSICYRE
jgi:ATP-dependent helicase/DNAse subunit B